MRSKSKTILFAAAAAGLPALILFPAWLFYQNFGQWRAAEANIKGVRAAINSTRDIYFHTLAAESALRSYIITGDRASLAPFNSAVSAMDRELHRLEILAKEHPSRRPESEKLKTLIKDRKASFQDTILLRRTAGFEPGRLKTLSGRGSLLSEEIRAVAQSLEKRERQELWGWELEARAAALQRGRLGTGALFGAFLLVAGALLLALRAVRHSRLDREALAAAHARLRGVLDSATQISIMATDVEGRITVFSAGAERLLGYRAEEVLGGTPDIFHLQEEVEARSGELSARLGRPVTGFGVFVEAARSAPFERREWTYVRKDGKRLTVELTVTAVRSPAGEITGFLGIAADITSRRHAQLQMRKLSTAVKSSPASIVITDRDAKIEYANPKFFELTGYTEKEMLGQDPKLLNSGSTPKSTIKELWDTILSGREWHGDLLNRKKNGELFWEHASISPVKDPAGNITHFIAVKVDITDRKLAARELEKAKDAALELARMKSEFLANMSHEIRTPMNAIIGMAGLLKDTQLTPRQKDYASTIATAGEALLDIINDILDFSKVESGRIVMETMDFDLRDTIESTLDLLAPRAQAKGLELAYIMEPGVPPALRGDPGRLRQVLMNLIGNAVKFTERGDILVRISVQSRGDGRTSLRFSVRDTGIGISAGAQRGLFSAFVQADSSTTRKYGGTGLGLSICKRLTEMMGGEIGLESEAGRGSTFWFILPFEEARTQPAAPDPAVMAGVTTLVVDDNAASREIVSHYLAEWKADIRQADSAEAALAALRAAAAEGRPVRLVITDMHMPGTDGLTLTAGIKADPELSRASVILLSSLGQELTAAEREAAGLAACIHKPLRKAALLGAISSSLSGKPDPAAVKEPEAQPSRNRYFRVLLAEDNVVNQKVAMRQLEKLGYECDVAANGLEALEALKRRPYGLVLMDCQMPEMDGFQATAEIRRMEADGRRTPVVAMTANALEGDRERCLAAGMDGYIPKPVRIESLADALKLWDTAFDQSTLKSLKDLAGPENPAFLKELFRTYLGDLPGRLEAIRAAVKSADAEALRQAAHALKGSSGNIGAQRLQKICFQLELAGRSGSLADAPPLLEDLEKEAAAARTEMEAMVSGVTP